MVGTTARPEKPVKLGYQPALDGLRAVAVATVLLFHLGVSWMPGGYLGVSVFFTLSGFLITTILIRERVVTGGIDTRAFYTRRLRRLMPASLLVIVGVCALVAFGVIADTGSQRGEILGALFQVQNWVSLFGGKSYAQLFQSPSPVAHFWSLAIEEQFYWIWPPVVTGLLAWSLKGAEPLRRAKWALCGLFVVFSLSVPLTLWLWSPDAVYFASWTRFAEILAGGALAALLSGKNPPEWVRWFGIPSLIAILVLSVVTPSGRGWAYSGGLPFFALISCALILSLQPAGPVRSILSTRPFVAVGRVSFGLYLFHWPVFVVLDASRTGLDGLSLGLLRMSVTIVITLLSYSLMESPIRERRVLPAPRQLVIYLGAAFVATAVFIFVVVAVPEAKVAPSVLGGGSGPTGSTGNHGAKPTVIAVLGDSVPSWLLTEADAGGFTRKDLVIYNGAHEACDAMVDLPDARDRRGDTLRPPANCANWKVSYPGAITRGGTTARVALLMIGTAPILDHLVNGRWVGPCDGIDWYLSDVAKRIEYLRSKNVIPVLAITSWPGPNSQFIYPSNYADRAACVRDAMKEFASVEGIPSFDLAPRFCPGGPASTCDATRKDGVHVDSEFAPAVLDWVIDQTLKVTAKERASGVTGVTGNQGANPTVIAVLGDSVPELLLTEADAGGFTRKDVVLYNGGHASCDGMVGLPDIRARTGETVRQSADCANWKVSYPGAITRGGTTAGVALLMIGTAPILDHLVNGRWVGPCDGIDWYLSDVAKRIEYLRSKNVIPVLAITSWPGPNSQFYYPSNYGNRAACVRDAMKEFASVEGILSFDLAPRFCPGGPASACDATRKDGVHVDAEVAPAVLDWVIDQTLKVTARERASVKKSM